MKHFLVHDGEIREVAHSDSVAVANGAMALPEFASTSQRYVQVQVLEHEIDEENVEVRIAGALLDFDDEGNLSAAHAVEEDDPLISDFERQTCAELALQAAVYDVPSVQ